MVSEDETESSRRLLRKWDETKKPGPRRKGHVPCKLIAVVLVAVVVVVASVMVLKPWEGNPDEDEQPDNQAEAGENVLFQYHANFAYLSAEDNLPVENVAIRFPCPNIENTAVELAIADWILYYRDEENVLYPQISYTPMTRNEIVYHLFKGNRTENLKILSYGVEPTIDGPKITYVLDNLYPREIFWITTYFQVPKEYENKVTLCNYGDTQRRSSAYYHHPLEQPINLSFWAQLNRIIHENIENVETFSRARENAPAGYWFWLYGL